MRKNNLISIVVPVYKVPEDYLKKNINNLINQTYSNIEIILVDDGSPDNCGEICDSFAKIDKRVKVIHQKNKGLSGARNTGVENSSGEWVMFVDGDDYLEINACEIIMNNLSENVDVLCFGAYRVSNDVKEILNNQYMENNKVYFGSDDILFLKKMVLNFQSRISTAWCKVINLNFIKKNDIYHDELLKQGAEGIEFCFRLFSSATKVKYIDAPLYNYIYNENSISSAPNETNNLLIIKCFSKIYSYIDKNDLELIDIFRFRMGYVIVTTAISSYFNPKYNLKYIERKIKMNEFLDFDIVKSSLEFNNIKKYDFSRLIILILVKYRFYFILKILGFIKNFK